MIVVNYLRIYFNEKLTLSFHTDKIRNITLSKLGLLKQNRSELKISIHITNVTYVTLIWSHTQYNFYICLYTLMLFIIIFIFFFSTSSIFNDKSICY